jgi:SCY1-like protein 1
MIRDQANKTLDTYLQRVRKHGGIMADTALPTSTAADTMQHPARIGTSNDRSWAGWAISSFTNKIAAARGEIQPTTMSEKTLAVTEQPPRPTSVPRTSQPAHARSNPRSGVAPSMGRSLSERPRISTNGRDPEPEIDSTEVDDWGADAWGAMDEEIADKDDDETFFDAATSRGVSPSPAATPAPSAIPAPAPPPFDDGGEPDFAGWLAAQSKAKVKKPLPKGLTKSTSSKDSQSKAAGTSKTALTTGSAARSTVKAPTSKIVTKPKDEAEDDGWGEAWD